MSKKKNNLSRKVASFIAGSLGLLSLLGAAYLNQTNLQHLSNENSIHVGGNNSQPEEEEDDDTIMMFPRKGGPAAKANNRNSVNRSFTD